MVQNGFSAAILSTTVSNAILKLAMKDSLVSFRKPQNSVEKKFVESYFSEIQTNRLGTMPLHYLLLFEKLLVDQKLPLLGDTGISANPEADSFILMNSPESSDVLSLFSGQKLWNYALNHSTNYDPSEDFFGLLGFSEQIQSEISFFSLEIGRELKLLHGHNAHFASCIKEVFRACYDDVELVQFLLEGHIDTDGAYVHSWTRENTLRERIKLRRSGEKDLCARMLGDILSILSVQKAKVNAASNLNGTIFSGKSILNMGVTNPGEGQLKKVTQQGEVIANVRFVMDEIEYWPRIDEFKDIIRIRSDANFQEFRELFSGWVGAISSGDEEQIQRLKVEVKSSNKAMRKAEGYEKVGRLVTYAGIPMLALDLLVGPYFGIPATIVGFGLQSKSDVIRKRNKWRMMEA